MSLLAEPFFDYHNNPQKTPAISYTRGMSKAPVFFRIVRQDLDVAHQCLWFLMAFSETLGAQSFKPLHEESFKPVLV